MADSIDDAGGGSPRPLQSERDRLRAEALRANLKRRKSQARVRAEAASGEETPTDA